MGPLLTSGKNATIDAVKAEKPNALVVGTHADILAKKADATVTYHRSWSNGWGVTAYVKAWINGTAVVPTERAGVEVGTEATYKF